MSNQAVKNKKAFTIGTVVFVLAIYIFLWGYLFFITLKPQIKTVSINLNEHPTLKEVEIKFQRHPKKQWYDAGNPLLGAQYDGEIINNTTAEMIDWSIEIQIPPESYIEGGWNGYYTVASDFLLINCDYSLDNSFIDPNTSRTFGCIMFTPKNYVPTYFVAHFTLKYKIQKTKLFWILSVILFAAVITGITSFFYTFRIKLLKHKEKVYREVTENALKAFANTIEIKDTYTRGHSGRVSKYAKLLAEYMGLRNDEVQTVYYGAILHDIGKILIPDEVLNKKTHLENDELQIMHNHAVIGYDILKDFSAVKNIALIVRHHHENFDGSGYPDKLKSYSIPLESRIIAVADNYDAMTTTRVYRTALSKEEAILELKKYSGIKYDPDIVDKFIELLLNGKLD